MNGKPVPMMFVVIVVSTMQLVNIILVIQKNIFCEFKSISY